MLFLHRTNLEHGQGEVLALIFCLALLVLMLMFLAPRLEGTLDSFPLN